MKMGRKQYIEKGESVRELRIMFGMLHVFCSHLALDTVGSLMKVK